MDGGAHHTGKVLNRRIDAAKIGVEFLQILPNSHCTIDQLTFLHDCGIRTTYFVANDSAKMREIAREGHDFVFTDHYSRLRPDYDAVASRL